MSFVQAHIDWVTRSENEQFRRRSIPESSGLRHHAFIHRVSFSKVSRITSLLFPTTLSSVSHILLSSRLLCSGVCSESWRTNSTNGWRQLRSP
jgi:hypothetical protein